MKIAEFKYEDNGVQLSIQISGELSSLTSFPRVIVKANHQISVVLAGAGNVNSAGLQGWIKWMTEMQTNNKNVSINFKMLPANFARLAHQVRGFLPDSSTVESFIAPYFCEDCDNNYNVVFTKGLNWNSSWNAEQMTKEISHAPCPECKTLCQIDAAPEIYLKL